MDKAPPLPAFISPQRTKTARQSFSMALFLFAGAALYWFNSAAGSLMLAETQQPENHQSQDIISISTISPYGVFPKPKDPFQFLPCTAATVPPPLESPDHRKAWAALFNPSPDHWSWGKSTADASAARLDDDPYAGRGIFLCGYLDVPLDYNNASDSRIFRLAITKYQVSGLAPTGSERDLDSSAGQKSVRTLIVEPGGPGGSGTGLVWRAAEQDTKRFTSGLYDVLGWDPRGVNTSLPALACFPFDADRDRWSLLTNQHRYAVAGMTRPHLELVDAMNNATFAACKEMLGDLPRFVSTTSVARDVEQIRIALDEPEVTGYFVSYGTGIGQTYANMYPEHVGRLVLDGTEYVRDHRLLGGFGWTALDNATNAWHDGFLGECVAAGPEHCALAEPLEEGADVTVEALQTRMASLLASLAKRPMACYTPSSGPSLVTHSALVNAIYGTLYNAQAWPMMAKALFDLEQGNTTLIGRMLDRSEWDFEPPVACPLTGPSKPSSDELGALVICADSYDAPQPPFTDDDQDKDGLTWWLSLWSNMTTKSWVSGDSRFYNVFPCRHYTYHFGSAAEVYRGDLNHSLSNPVLLIAEIYDPATPLRNGRRLLAEMGENARLVVHHGYGHSSRDKSKCTSTIVREYVLHGKVPEKMETDCFADEKPYRYELSGAIKSTSRESDRNDPLEVWREHMREMASSHPGLIGRM